MTTTVSLLTLDTAKPYVSSTFLPGDARHAWEWVASQVAAEWRCDADDVHCVESELGDVVTVAGVPVALVVIEWRPNLH